MEGWIKLHRKIIENPWWLSEPFSRSQAWIDLLLLANSNEGFFFKRGIRVEVKRGQIGHDLDTLAKKWKWSRGKVERFFSMLEMDNQIIRQKNNITTLISIVNYEMYQANDKANSNTNGHQTIKQTDTNKNEKKEKNILDNIYFEKNKEIDSAFKDYLQLRVKSKYTMTDRAVDALVRKLRELSDDDTKTALRIIENAILGKWKSFYKAN